jgi:hypothetical protein
METYIQIRTKKAINIENTLHLLSLAFTDDIDFVIGSISSDYLENLADDKSMVMQLI